MITVTPFEYPGDLKIVNAARGSFGVAYDQWSDTPRGLRTRSDPELMNDLATDGHELPFRHVHATLRCNAPLPVARQLGKHQVGFSWSEISRRYKKGGITFYRMNGTWRADPETRQGTGELLPDSAQSVLNAIQERNIEQALEDFHEALTLGASMEQARMLLPQSMEVLWVWTGSLLGWADLYYKRNNDATQLETRQFVQAAAEVVRGYAPKAWDALVGLR